MVDLPQAYALQREQIVLEDRAEHLPWAVTIIW